MSVSPTTTDQQRFDEIIAEYRQRIDGHFGIMVRDFTTDSEFTFNATDVFPTASTMKIPLLYTVYTLAQQGELDLSSRVTLRPELRVPGSGVLQHLDSGLQPTIRDLCELMIIVSDNEATDLLYGMVGSERLAQMLGELGLHQTHLPHTVWQMLSQWSGIDPDDPGISYDTLREQLKQRRDTNENRDDTGPYDGSSPADMVRVLGLIEDGHGLSGDNRAAMIDMLKHQKFNTVIPGRLPDDAGIEVAHKTGSLKGVRNDAGIVYAPDARFAIAIMSRDLTDSAGAVNQFAHLSRQLWDMLSTQETPS